MRRSALALAGLVLFGCRGREAARTLDSQSDATLLATMECVANGANTRPSNEASVRLGEALREAPAGYAFVVVGMKASREHEAIVILTDPSAGRILPLFIGGTEGMSIELRLAKKKFDRPLTHDLLDAAIRELGGRVIRSQIDSVQGESFFGSVVVLVGERTVSLAARPSDAIAMAIGNDAPLFVAKAILDRLDVAEKDEDVARAQTRPTPDPLPL